jgi:hypothetical protein
VDHCEHGGGHPVSVKGGEFLDKQTATIRIRNTFHGVR